MKPWELEWLSTSPHQGPVMLARAATPAVQCRATPGWIEKAMPSSHGVGATLLQKAKFNELRNLFYPGKSENDFNLHSSCFLSYLGCNEEHLKIWGCFYIGASSPKASQRYVSPWFPWVRKKWDMVILFVCLILLLVHSLAWLFSISESQVSL